MEAKKEVVIMEAESGDSSTEESESPRSVVVPMRKKVERVHNQILRIREEESHIGEDIFGSDNEDKKDVICEGCVGGIDERRRRQRRVHLVLVSRPILPCSPLSGKSNVKRPYTEATEINQIQGRC